MTAGTPPGLTSAAAEPRSIDLREYWQIVRRRWVLVLVVTLIGAIGGAGYAVDAGHKYAATSQVVVTGVTQGPGRPTRRRRSNLQVNMSTEQAVAQSPPVIAQAAKIIKISAATLQQAAAKRLTVTVPASTLTTSNVLQITWRGRTPGRAGGRERLRHRVSVVPAPRARRADREPRGRTDQQVNALEKQIARLTGQMTRTRPGSSAHAGPGHQAERADQPGRARLSNQLASLPTYNAAAAA